MSANGKVLVIDAGNTSVKWTAFDEDKVVWMVRDVHLKSQSTHLNSIGYRSFQPNKVYFASVRTQSDNKKLLSFIESLYPHQPCYELKTTRQACGVINPYTEPSRLGVDRWLNVLAAKRLFSNNVVLFDAGTALKVELIECNGAYKGGYIVPSFDMMKNVLVNSTGQIKIDAHDILEGVDVIDNTGMAVYLGCWQMLIAFVEKVCAEHTGKRFIFTGGNGLEILQRLQVKGEYYANLVSYGAKVLGDEVVGCE